MATCGTPDGTQRVLGGGGGQGPLGNKGPGARPAETLHLQLRDRRCVGHCPSIVPPAQRRRKAGRRPLLRGFRGTVGVWHPPTPDPAADPQV